MGLPDWIIVAAFCIFILFIGTLFSKRASASMKDFFVSGRSLPWWLAGTSMLATSFACDTPLHVTRVIREDGLSGAWFYWNGIIGGILITFFFSRLWRRSELITDAQFIELRYSGKGASLLRFTVALFRGGVLEIITLGWVLVGMVKIVTTLMDLPLHLEFSGVEIPTDVLVVVVLVLIALFYTMAAGLWGVVTTDFIEFLIAMAGSLILTLIALGEVGGIGGLKDGLSRTTGALDFLPSGGERSIPLSTLLVYLGVMWWTNPEVDGSGQRAQRFLSAKNEKHALASGIWNMAVQYIFRNWFWYILALTSLILFPGIEDHEKVYPMMISRLLPVGLKGMMVASFLAAFMSTVDTHLNLSASYLVNDVYRRFLKRGESEGHYILVSRITIVLVAGISAMVALNLGSVLAALKLKTELAAGLGLLYLVRWYWWRVNALSEISALVTSVATCMILQCIPSLSGDHLFPMRLVIIVAASFLVWFPVTLLTRPEPEEHLKNFYRKVRPSPLFWGGIPALCGPLPEREPFGWIAFDWLLGIVLVFSGMFGLGNLILGNTGDALLLLALCTLSGLLLLKRNG